MSNNIKTVREYQNNLIKSVLKHYKGELQSDLISIVLDPKKFVLVDGQWIEELDNVSSQKLSTKTKDIIEIMETDKE